MPSAASLRIILWFMQFANLVVESLQSRVIIDRVDARSSLTVDELPFHNGPARKSNEILRVLVVVPFRPMSSSTCGVARTRNG